MFLRKENTWTQNLRKSQYIRGTKTIKDPLIRQSQEFLSDKFIDYDFTNDAIFESFRDYPRKKQLYRTHKDVAKDYERKVKFYKSCQRWYSTESNRQIQKVEERFSKLLHYTFESNVKKTKGLQKGYSKWVSRHGKVAEFDKTKDHTKHQTLAASINRMDEEKLERSSPVISSQERIHSLKSISLDNIPKVEEENRMTGAQICEFPTHSVSPQIQKSLSNWDIRHIGKERKNL